MTNTSFLVKGSSNIRKVQHLNSLNGPRSSLVFCQGEAIAFVFRRQLQCKGQKILTSLRTRFNAHCVYIDKGSFWLPWTLGAVELHDLLHR